jgi:predicted neuraminidase
MFQHRFAASTILLTYLLCGATAARVTADDANRPAAIMTSEFIYDEAPFPSCHASTIVEADGRLITAWFGGTEERHPDVGIWLSHHKDGRWTPPVEVANGVESPTKRYPTWNPVLFQPKNGPLMLFYKVGPSPSKWWGMVKTSDDGGHTWSEERRLPDGIFGPIKNKPVQLASGDILSPSSTEHDGWRVHFERSTDGGKTWTATPPVNDGRKIAAIQPSILVHAERGLQSVGRTKSGRVFEVWSEDDGKTWGELTLTSLPNPSSGTDAATLADGRHLLVYNHSDVARNPLNVAISEDGKEWRNVLELENDPSRHFAYPAVIQTADGLVHITYTWNRERIKHVVVDPSRLGDGRR